LTLQSLFYDLVALSSFVEVVHSGPFPHWKTVVRSILFDKGFRLFSCLESLLVFPCCGTIVRSIPAYDIDSHVVYLSVIKLFSLLYRYRQDCQYPLQVFLNFFQTSYCVGNVAVELFAGVVEIVGSKFGKSVDAEVDDLVSHSFYLLLFVAFSIIQLSARLSRGFSPNS